MSDAAHLLIPFASCDDPGCVAARRDLHLPALEKLLARLAAAGADEGDAHSLSMPHERVLARAVGLPATDGRIPWAAWESQDAGACAWITPCHWRVGQDHVAMPDPAQLALSAAESQALLAVMQPWFDEDGITLEYIAPTRWLARGDVFRDFPTASLDRVSGRVIDAWMPRGEGAKAVRRLQQEMQMLLYTHAITDERAGRGLLPVNSFWVSGAGALSSAPARESGMRVVDALRQPALSADWTAWCDAWRRIEADECAPLLAALDRGEQVALTLCGERNARTFAGAGGGFFGKLRASLRGARAAAVFDSL